MKINFIHFLKTGSLGNITLTTSRHEIYDLLGTPDDISYNDKLWKKAKIWKYHSLQIAFEQDKVSLIGIYFREKLSFPVSIQVDGFFPSECETLESIKSLLATNQIKVELEPKLTFDQQLCLITEKRIHVLFRDGLLGSVQFA
jgi:hypothetical protein